MAYRLIDAAVLSASSFSVAKRRPVKSAMALEPRIALDAAAAAAGIDALAQTEQAQSTTVLPALPIEAGEEAGAAASMVDIGQEPAGNEIAFIDGALSEQAKADIKAALRPGVEYIELSSASDGVGQIHAALEGRTEIAALHIISEGSAGRFQLGSTVVDQVAVAGQLAEGLAGWAAALRADADILIYGCDVGASGSGLAAQIAQLTGADVGMSVDRTGAASRGGDWDLELTSGDINATVAVSSSAINGLDLLLAVPTINPDTVSVSADGSTVYLSGTCDPTVEGLQVEFDGNVFTSLDQVLLVNGDWSLFAVLDTPLQPGNYDVTVTVVDSSGNVITDGSGNPITDLSSQELAVLAPAPNAPTLNSAVSSADGSSVSLAGNYDVNSAGLRVTLDGASYTSLDSTILLHSDNGSWELFVNGLNLQPGSYPVLVEVIDASGQAVLDEQGFVLAVSGELLLESPVAPGAPGVSTATASVDGTSVFLSGTYDVNSPALIVDFAGQSYSSLDGRVILNADGSWELSADGLSLVPGTYEVTVSVADALGVAIVDGSGNLLTDATSDELVVYEPVPASPAVTYAHASADGISAVLRGSYDARSEGLLVEFAGLQFSSLDGGVLLDADGNWELLANQLQLVPGIYDVVVSVIDAQGNGMTDGSGNPLVDSTVDELVVGLINDAVSPPAIFDANASDGGNFVVITGSYDIDSAGLVVELAGQQYTADQIFLDPSNGTWELLLRNPGLQPGLYDITVWAIDSSGNEVAGQGGSLQIVGAPADTEAPAAPFVLRAVDNMPLFTSGSDGFEIVLDGGGTNDETPALGGTAEPFSTIRIYLVDVENGGDPRQIGSTVVGEDGEWSFDLSESGEIDLLNGETYSFVATATDASDNQSEISNLFTLKVDSAGPVGGVDELCTRDRTPCLEGFAHDERSGKYVSELRRLDIELQGRNTQASWRFEDVGFDGETGRWSFQIENELDDDDYDVKLVMTDVVGNVAQHLQAGALVVDTTPPQAPVLGFADDVGLFLGSSDAGLESISADGFSNDTQPLLRGSAEAGSLVSVYVNDHLVGDARADANGDWSLQFPEDGDFQLVGGECYEFTARCEDRAGNLSEYSEPFVVAIDTAGPISGVDSVITNETMPALSGTVVDADEGSYVSGLHRLDVEVIGQDGSVQLFEDVSVDDDGNWSVDGDRFSENLNEGHYDLRLVAIDNAGNVAETVICDAICVDLTPPDAPSLMLTDDVGIFIGDPSAFSEAVADGGITNDPMPTLGGYSEPGSVVVISLDGEEIGMAMADAYGVWGFSLSENEIQLEDGIEYEFSVLAQDVAGNVSCEATTLTVSVDLAAPEVSADPVTHCVTCERSPTISGVVADPGDAFVSGVRSLSIDVMDAAGDMVYSAGDVSFDGDGNWTLELADVELADGSYSVRVTLMDEAGNAASQCVNDVLLIDTVPPEQPVIAAIYDEQGVFLGDTLSDSRELIASGAYSNDAELLLEGQAEPGSMVQVYLEGEWIGEVESDPDGYWYFALADAEADIELEDGATYAFSVVARDQACNSSDPSQAYLVVMDFTPPEVAIGCMVTHDSTPVLTGWIRDVVGEEEQVGGSGIYGLDVEIYDAENRLWFSSAAVIDEVSGAWSLEIPGDLYESGLPDGAYDIRVSATDMAGNVSQTCFEDSLKVDAVGVVLSIDTVIGTDTGNAPTVNSGGVTRDNTLLISGSASDGLFFELSGAVMVYEGDILIGEADLIRQAEGQYTWSLETGPLTDGPHSFYAVIREVAECAACDGFDGNGDYGHDDGEDDRHDDSQDYSHADNDHGDNDHGDDDLDRQHADRGDQGDDCEREYVFVRNVPSSVISVSIDTTQPLPPFVPYTPPTINPPTEQAAPVFTPATDTVAAAVNGEEFAEYISDTAPDTVLAATNNTDFSQYISNQAPEIVRIASNNSNPGGGTAPTSNFITQDPSSEETFPDEQPAPETPQQDAAVQGENEVQPLEDQENPEPIPLTTLPEQQVMHPGRLNPGDAFTAISVGQYTAGADYLVMASKVSEWESFNTQVVSMLHKFEVESRELELLS